MNQHAKLRVIAPLLGSVLFLGLALGCARGGATAPGSTVQPWTVVATQFDATRAVPMLRIDYFAPTGELLQWERPLLTVDGEMSSYWTCWQEAVLGQPLPDCARSETGGDHPGEAAAGD